MVERGKGSSKGRDQKIGEARYEKMRKRRENKKGRKDGNNKREGKENKKLNK